MAAGAPAERALPAAPGGASEPGAAGGDAAATPVAAGARGAAAEGPAPDDPLDAVAAQAAACRRCRLCETRQSVVFGEGPRRPRLMVIGEAPGAEEDASGRPFIGAAGQLLTRMLLAIGLAREDVYIANVVKCRPPGNRDPGPDEVAACRPYLDEQIRLLDPELLLLLGAPALKTVLQTTRGITAMRGQVLRTPDGRPALPTFHPSYVLRYPEARRAVWDDLRLAAATLGLTVPPRPA
ncbi:MAG: uracil-DNA glycosylase [Planctomycetia bacterium]|nr:uracil-DNA glycosylase [Planctomycetia bacterium]